VSKLAVVDTSVAVKWLVTQGEESLQEAAELLAAHRAGEIKLCAPTIMPIEIANVAVYSSAPVDAAVAIIEAISDFEVELFEALPARLIAATEIARDHRLSVYDALFLQLAVELGCPLMTADRRAFANVFDSAEIRLL